MTRRRLVLAVAGLAALTAAVLLLRRPVKRWWRTVTYEVSTGRFQDPEGLAVDPAGNLWVADEDRHQLTVLDPEGETILQARVVEGYRSGGTTGHITSGDGIVAIGPGRVVAIAQFNLAELVLEDGALRCVRVFGRGKGRGAEDFGDPEGVARDPETGEIYATDEDNRRIHVFTPDGTHVRAWPVEADPESLCVSGDRVYVTFSKDDWVGCFSRRGELRFRFEHGLDNPDFAAVSPDGLLYVTDQGNGRIRVFAPEGKRRFTIGRWGRGPGEFRDPEDLAFDPDGNLVVADGGNHRLQVFTPDGKFLREIR